MLFPLLSLLAGCPASTDDTSAATGGLTVTNFVQQDCDGDSGTLNEALRADPGTAGNTVDVAHDAVSGTCCVSLAASATAADGTINVTYTESGTPCDCMCRYDVTYTLGNVPSGDWSVAAGGVSDAVSVP